MKVEIEYKDLLGILNMLQYNYDELQSSPYNQRVSAVRHKIHVALGEAEKEAK